MPGDEGDKSIELWRAERGLTRRFSVSRRLDRWTRDGVWVMIMANTLDDLRAQARPASEGPAEPVPAEEPAESGPERRVSLSARVEGLTRYGVWLVVMSNLPGERRFQVGLITKVVGALAVASLLKNNQARPVRRAINWYNVRSQVEEVKEKVLEVATTHPE